MLLQSIGESNANGGTPYGLQGDATKLFLDFIKEAVPVTGNPTADKATTQTVLSRIKQTFGLTDEQVKDLQRKINENLPSNKASENPPGATNTSNIPEWMQKCPHCQKAEPQPKELKKDIASEIKDKDIAIIKKGIGQD